MHIPFAAKEFVMLSTPDGGIDSDLASFKRAHASSADPKLEADTERAARARR